MADLNINLNGLELKKSCIDSIRTFGYGLEFQDFIQLDKLGGFIVKGTTLKTPRREFLSPVWLKPRPVC